MSGDTQQSGSGETPQSSVKFWAESAAWAKAWAAVAVAFFGVVALALFLFDHHQKQRAAEINAQLEQNAARLGQEVEVKYKNYRTVVDNVTRMMSVAGVAAAKKRHDALERATSASQQAKTQEGQLQAIAAEATRRSNDALRIAKLAEAANQRAEIAELGSSYKDAGAIAARALEAATAAIASFAAHAPKVVDAQRDLDQKSREADLAQQAFDAFPVPAEPPLPKPVAAIANAVGQTGASSLGGAGDTSVPSAGSVPASGSPPPSALPVPNVSASSVSSATGSLGSALAAPSAPPPLAVPPAPSVTPRDAALGVLRRAVEARTRAQNVLETARADFEVAQRQADSARQDSSKKELRAREAFSQWAAAVSAYEESSRREHADNQRSKEASDIAKAADASLLKQREALKMLNEDLNRVQTPTPSSVVSDLLSELKTVVLPSQVSLLESCKSEPSRAELELCVARATAKSSNEVEGLEMTRCASGSSVPSLRDDGRFLIIPPTEIHDVPPASETEPEDRSLPACGRVKLSRFLAAADPSLRATMAGSGDGAFDAVFLLRRDGTTLHSLDLHSSLRMSALPDFKSAQADVSTTIEKLKLGATEYRAFLQPIRLRLASGDKSGASVASDSREHADLLVCGLAHEDRLKNASYAIGLSSYLWVVLLLGFGLLSLPLAKLWLLGPKTSFTAFDVTMLATSALLLSLLGAVVILGFLAHNRLGERADAQIRDVGTDIAKRLSSEISAAGSTLESFNTEASTSYVRGVLVDAPDGRTSESQRQACSRAGGALVDGILFDDEGPGRSVCERTHVPTPPGSTWKLIYMMDSAGNGRVEFTPKDYGPTPVSLRNRDYFKRAYANDTACVGTGSDICRTRAVPQLVRSVISGAIELIVAQPVCAQSSPCQATEQPIGVAAIETDLDLFRTLSLPLGVQAAVIDESGRIMLHSNNDAHHEQDLFNEVSDPEELRATLAARVTGTFSLSYLGQMSRVHVEPLALPGSGWHVITIVPSSIVDVATTDMVLATLFGYGLWVGAIVLAACCVLVARQTYCWIFKQDLSTEEHAHAHGISLRPRASHSQAYARLGLFAVRAGVIACALAVFLTPVLPTTIGILAVLAIGYRTVLLLPRAAKPGTAREKRESAPTAGDRSWRDYLPLTYLLCIAGLAQVFVMAPASVLFSGAYDYVVDDLVRAEHDHLTTAFRRHPRCVETLAKLPEEAVALRCGDDAVIFASSQEPAQKHELAGNFWGFLRSKWLSPMPYLADLLPRVGSAEVQDSGRLYRDETMVHPEPSPTQYASIRQPSTMELSLTTDSASLLLLDSPLPRLVSLQYRPFNLVALILIAAAALAATHAAGFHSLRRLFFLDLLRKLRDARADAAALFSPQTRARSGPRRVFVTFPSEAVREVIHRDQEWTLLDLTVDEQPWMDSSRSHLLVDELAAVMNNPAAVVRLRRAKQSQAHLVILSQVDPIRSALPELRHPWSVALQGFEFVELCVDAEAGELEASPSSLEVSGRTAPTAPTAAQVARWWLESDAEERRILGQLAIGGYVTPHPANVPTLRSLVARDLLDCESMTILSPELERYTREVTSPQDQAAWADSDRNSAWMALRVPLSTGVAALFVAVTMAKPELGAASAIVPTLTAGLPTVLKVLAQMVSPKGT